MVELVALEAVVLGEVKCVLEVQFVDSETFIHSVI